jgi:tRNA threonylcarbamoyladenosine biosynthesis protein TsaE
MKANPQSHKIHLKSTQSQIAFGRSLGHLFLKHLPHPISLKIAVLGEVGTGKTTLAQGLGHGLGVPEDEYINSPTFALLQTHQGAIPFHHIDLYRLNDPSELYGLGLDDLLDQGISYIEWPQRAEQILGESFLLMGFEHDWDEETGESLGRTITIKLIGDHPFREDLDLGLKNLCQMDFK